jgi:hypothetical protein
LKEIKGFIQTAANALYSVLPNLLDNPQNLDFTPTSATSSANFTEIALEYLRKPAVTIKETFDEDIDGTILELNSKFVSYKGSRENLVDNRQHCTDDPVLLQDIENNEIGDNYIDLEAKYKRYKDDSSELYKGIIDDVNNIVDRGIDDDTQQQETKHLFKKIQNKCTAFAEFVTDRMDKIRAEIVIFNDSVANYLSNVQKLTDGLIACINHSIDKTLKHTIDDIDVQALNDSHGAGDKLISDIKILFDQLKAAGP